MPFFRALVRTLKKHRVGGIVFVVLVSLLSLVGDQIKQAIGDALMHLFGNHRTEIVAWITNHPAATAWIACAIWISFCAALAGWDELVRKYVEFVREPDIPLIDVLWKPGEEIYCYSYTLPPDPAVNLHFRVCILNLSKRTKVEGIEVQLDSIKPRELPMVPCHLRLMNNFVAVEPVITRFNLNRDDRKFIDVMAQAPNATEFHFWHTVLKMEKPIPAQGYTFVISATSESTGRVFRTFVLEKDGVYWNMRMIPNA